MVYDKLNRTGEVIFQLYSISFIIKYMLSTVLC